MSTRLTRAAKQDVREIRRWYREQGRGLDLEFLRALEAELDTIARFPEGFSIVHGATRRALLSRFPYAVYFSSEPDVALVVAVLHTARDPRRIEERGG